MTDLSVTLPLDWVDRVVPLPVKMAQIQGGKADA
jgi:hypothetical protein